MKMLLTRMLRMVPLLAMVLTFLQTNAQRPYGPLAETDFQITMQNIVQPPGTNNIIEFDIYIFDTDPSQVLPMATAQFGINFNLGILNGAATTSGMTIALPYSEGYSDLPSSMAPNGVSTLASGLIRIAGRAAPGCPDGFPISNEAPGTRLNRFRFTSPVPFAFGSTPNFVFTSSTATNPSYATRFAWYNPACTNVQLPVVPGVNALVFENIFPLCGEPILFNVTGGGLYCEGGTGVPVGLSGSQPGVIYTLNPGAVVVAGDDNPITFGNQLAGSYTVVATSDGTNPAICNDPVNMTGGADVTANPSSTVEFTESACDSYTWALNGEIYTVSGDYTYVVGCVTNILHLTITPGSIVEFYASGCNYYSWYLTGVDYTVSGDYYYVDGCVTNILHLTITQFGTFESTVSACGSYTWEVSGETYTASGNYYFLSGCSTFILHLTIINDTEEFTITACDSYFWYPFTFTESGDYTFNEGECITIVLHLTIIPYTTVEVSVNACDAYYWPATGGIYTASGDYYSSYVCETTILHLTITESNTEEFTESAVGSYTWALNGQTYTASGDYTFVEGCVTNILHLTIITCPAASTWSGIVSNDWFTTANWTPEVLPCETTNVTIPAGCPYYPTINPLIGNSVDCYVTIAAMTIHDGGSLIGQQYLCVLSDVVVERTILNSNFHLISSPVDAVTFGDVFLPAYWFEVWAREYNEPSGDWVNRFISDNLNVGQGYSVQMTTASQTATFTGALNGYDVTRTLSNMNPGTDLNRIGWNLLGNPFPSAIDWDAFSTGAYNAQVAVWDQAGAGNYIYWNGSVGSLTDGIIPTQNGFFVKTATDGASLTIPMSAQVHNSLGLYKGAVANALELRANGNNYYDATFVHFNSNATADFDNQYDAFKLEGLEAAPQLYNMAADYNLSINELPFEGNEVVNLGFKCGVAGIYSLNASGLGSFSSSTPILLEDLKLNVIQDLRLTPVYSFNYTTNDSEARFKLHFKAASDTGDPANNGIFVYSHEHTVVINNTTNLNGEIRIFDMTGRELKDAGMSSSSETRLPLQVAVGTYIVKVTTARGTVNQKVYVK